MTDKAQLFNRLTHSPYSALFLIIVFLIVKITHLNISFFWDESWVYAPAVQAMAERGPSLLPDSISLDYSRGHPLLFHFLAGIWIKIFGTSFVAMHSFPLLLSITYLAYTYKLFAKVFENSSSFWITAFLCSQAIFIAQSSMVLPEIMLALFSIAAIYYYLNDKIWAYLIFGIAAILTKETGIIVISSIVLYDFINNTYNRRNFLAIIQKGIVLSLPLLTFILHMLYLKNAFGWYLYPEHTGMMKQDLNAILTSFANVILDQTFIQKRFLIGVPFVILYLTRMIKNWSSFNIISIIVTFLLTGYMYTFHGTHFLFPTIFLFCLLHFCISEFINSQKKHGILLLAAIFILAYGLFSAANFYTVRYLLSTFIFINAIPIYFLAKHSLIKKFIVPYFLICIGIFIFEAANPSKINDVNLSYLSYCPAQMEVVEYFEENELYGEQVNTMFLMSVALSDRKAGYRKTDEKFDFINNENSGKSDYYIFYNVEPNGNRERLQKSDKAELIKRIEKRHVWFEIWKEQL